MCCQGLLQVRTPTAEFCTYWSVYKALLWTANRTPLQTAQASSFAVNLQHNDDQRRLSLCHLSHFARRQPRLLLTDCRELMVSLAIGHIRFTLCCHACACA